MANEIRKTLGRNMRFAQMNEDIDNQINRLRSHNTGPDVQMQINNLMQQKALNTQQMARPMSETEYAEYDNNGQYIGNTTKQNTGGFGQAVADGVNHAAQGASLGWSDEAFGAIGGAGRVVANGLMRAAGQNVNGESFGDAWNKGYTEYRDFARQELQDGYQRNSTISILSEVGGALASPIKPFKGIIGATANGVIGGVGMTDTNNPAEYAINIGLNTAGSIVGEKFGSILGDRMKSVFGKNSKNLSFGATNLSKPARVFVKAGSNGLTNQINNWRKDEK